MMVIDASLFPQSFPFSMKGLIDLAPSYTKATTCNKSKFDGDATSFYSALGGCRKLQ